MAGAIVITGGNGWIGGYAGAALQAAGWDVTGVSRTPEAAAARHPGWTWVGTGPDLEDAVGRAGVVLNLAGRHAFEQPWTPEHVAAMRDSRLDITARVVRALADSGAPERVLISGSGYPVYGDGGDALLTEDDAPKGDLVLGGIDAEWERAAEPARTHGVRLVILRLGSSSAATGARSR